MNGGTVGLSDHRTGARAALTFATDDEATNWALAWLSRRGFFVTKPKRTALVTPKELREQCAPHLGAQAFHQRLTHACCPAFAAQRGPKGALVYIAPTPDLVAWLSRPAAPGLRGGSDDAAPAAVARLRDRPRTSSPAKPPTTHDPHDP